MAVIIYSRVYSWLCKLFRFLQKTDKPAFHANNPAIFETSPATCKTEFGRFTCALRNLQTYPFDKFSCLGHKNLQEYFSVNQRNCYTFKAFRLVKDILQYCLHPWQVCSQPIKSKKEIEFWCSLCCIN